MKYGLTNDDKGALFKLINADTALRLDKLESSSISFSHYTSADIALEILRNRKMWMRSTIFMNDYSEITHGKDCFTSFWKNSEFGKRLKGALSKINQNIVPKINFELAEIRKTQQFETYIISFSEHDKSDPYESAYGRLSMWRAYGGAQNVALILNPNPFLRKNKLIDITTMPVFYETPNEYAKRLSEMTQRIENNLDFIAQFNPEIIADIFIRHFHYSIISTKHPGFHEEREWRAVFSPRMDNNCNMKLILQELNGKRQGIYILDIDKLVSGSMHEGTMDDFIENIMIGPVPDSTTIINKISPEIMKFHFGDAHDKIVLSEIPFRR